MSPLTVFCPRNGYPMNSGIEIDRDTYDRLRRFTLRVICPECGERHDMRVGEGHLARAEATAFNLLSASPPEKAGGADERTSVSIGLRSASAQRLKMEYAVVAQTHDGT